jgi:lipoate-protein ligase A
MAWCIEQYRGAASAFHARPLADEPEPTLWWFEVERPALVLGSAQAASHVDAAACARLDVEIVRRHSGGGAVLLWPDEVAWFDIEIPRSHARWDADIARAAWWVGEMVAEAIGDSTLEVHRSGLVRSGWSSVVCFAGMGPGELSRGGRKVLGLSQRRTRSAIRYQCAVYRTWDPGRLHELLAEPRPGRDELAAMVDTASLTLDAVSACLAVR